MKRTESQTDFFIALSWDSTSSENLLTDARRLILRNSPRNWNEGGTAEEAQCFIKEFFNCMHRQLKHKVL